MTQKIGTIKTGVLSGSVLGPRLFLLYVNDIARAVSILDVKVMLIADDTNVFIQGTNTAEQVMWQQTVWTPKQ